MDRVPHLLAEEQIDSLQILARRLMHELEIRCKQDDQSTRQGLHLATSLRPSVTILLVEDNDNLRNLLQRTLEGVGFSVFAAADGAEALRLCQERKFTLDLVVSDIVMPRLNGIELLHRVHAARPETQFLFITGFGEQFPEIAELKYGVNVLEKPFLPSELISIVKKTLEQGNATTGTEG
jgi:DNA-binding response OmpR family regulator